MLSLMHLWCYLQRHWSSLLDTSLAFHCSSLASVVLATYFTFMFILAQSCKALINVNFQWLKMEWRMCLGLRKLLIFCNIILVSLHKQCFSVLFWFFSFFFRFSLFSSKFILPVNAVNVFCQVCISRFPLSSPIIFDGFLQGNLRAEA